MTSLVEDIQGLKPTCRRGEGFADNLSIENNSISGRAVPYGRTVRLIGDLFEKFEKGAFQRQLTDPARIKICLEHGEVVGRCSHLEEKDDGLYFKGSISNNPNISEAKRAQALLDEELVDELSIGFQTVKGGTDIESTEKGTLYRHKRARLLEISLVPWGVYGREATLSRAVLIDPIAEFHEQRKAEARQWLKDFQSRM